MRPLAIVPGASGGLRRATAAEPRPRDSTLLGPHRAGRPHGTPDPPVGAALRASTRPRSLGHDPAARKARRGRKAAVRRAGKWSTSPAPDHCRTGGLAWFRQAHPKAPLTCVAYFSMEFMLSEALPIYSGGLGNVAGDQLKAASTTRSDFLTGIAKFDLPLT